LLQGTATSQRIMPASLPVAYSMHVLCTFLPYTDDYFA
jgi:hypothetical protein